MRKINEKISLKKTRKNFAKKIKIKPKKHENFAIKGRIFKKVAKIPRAQLMD